MEELIAAMCALDLFEVPFDVRGVRGVVASFLQLLLQQLVEYLSVAVAR